ncbi:MAG: hypothetical protein GY714_08435 [Desulfobacterales bacterium]|nr:hypothetical protein [Desulfobacterales bacterium]MCP4159627.1 hypothetical protein [Deltaproteobacteria bacterium]
MKYQDENKAKADFKTVYESLTPHNYIKEMDLHNYRIGDETKPFFAAAAEYMNELNGEAWPVQMLDVGCSYGIGSATVRYGCSFQEMVSFFSSRAPTNYLSCCETTRMWLNVVQPALNLRCVGFDCSENAINFALDAGILDAGITANLEKQKSDTLSKDDLSWIRTSNLLLSSGAIGYITDKTLSVILEHLGKDHPGENGPFAVMSILRMFDKKNINEVFNSYGYKFDIIENIYLPQREFIDQAEKTEIINLLNKSGICTENLEDEGMLIAELCVASPPALFKNFYNTIKKSRTISNLKKSVVMV